MCARTLPGEHVSMQIVLDWLLPYLNRNYTDVLQGLVFAAVTLLRRFLGPAYAFMMLIGMVGF